MAGIGKKGDFREHLRIIDTFEHGLSIHFFVWISMLLQVAKLLVISGPCFAKFGFVHFPPGL